MNTLKLAVITAIFALVAGAQAQMRLNVKSPVGVLSVKAVQKELKLTEQQIALVKQVDADLRATISSMMGGGFSGGSLEELQAQVAAESNKLRKQLRAALADEQRARLIQLDLQFGAPDTILNEAYAAELKLTDEQKTKIKAYQQDFLDQMGDLQQAGVTDPDELTIRRAKICNAAIESIEAVLTNEQRETLVKLKGELVKA